LMNGAIPTETARAILKFKGALYKKHLLVGVRKGAFDMEEAERRFAEWQKRHEEKLAALTAKYNAAKEAKAQADYEREKAYSDARAQKRAESQAAEAEEQTAEESANENEEAGEE